MINKFKLLILFALCNETYSFFNTKPILTNKFTNYRYMMLPMKCNNGLFNENSNVSNVSIIPMLRPKPIPVISFDDLFLNWNIINRIFLSANRDRIIILYGNDKKGVYYIDYNQLKKIEYMMTLTSVSISIEPVCNLDNPWFYLYCSPPKKKTEEMKFSLFNNSHENPNKCDDNDDDLNNDYGFGFGIGM